MPSLSEVSLLGWKRFMLTTEVATYAVFDAIKAGEDTDEIDRRFGETVSKMIEAQWIVRVAGSLVITSEGDAHLRSF